jgi:CP family cyanate transporter-like MFS transporter
MILANIGMAICFPLSLLLAVLRGNDATQTRLLSIMMQSVGYLMAAFSPTIMGAFFDLTSSWSKALGYVVVLGALQAVISWEVGKASKIH